MGTTRSRRRHTPPQQYARKSFAPDNLARDFGFKTPIARHAVGTLYQAVLENEPEALRRWKTLFGNASGHDPDRTSAAIAKPPRYYGTPDAGAKPDAVLFALHTYYAILVRMLLERLAADGTLGGLDVAGFFADDLFSWHTTLESAPIQQLTGQLTAAWGEYDAGSLLEALAAAEDPLGQLYQAIFPRTLRHKLGEYYTPAWLADHVLQMAGYSGDLPGRLLDPACGSGTFLIGAIRRIRAADNRAAGGGELCRKILANVVGFDLNPLAVMAARANYLIAIADLLPEAGSVFDEGKIEIPIHLCDSILGGPDVAEQYVPPCGGRRGKSEEGREKRGERGGKNAGHSSLLPLLSSASPGVAPGVLPGGVGRFDFVVGNPPWIAWDNLPDDYRRATKPLWERYGLFSLSGNQARHGGGKKDLSMLMLYSTADRYLRSGGRLAMVITQTLFQTKGAGDGFRRFRLGPRGEPLKVIRVDDMVALRPFKDAANWTSTVVIEKGTPTHYPVPYVKWSPGTNVVSGCGGDVLPGEEVTGAASPNHPVTQSPSHPLTPSPPHPVTPSPRHPLGQQPIQRTYHAEPIDPARPSSPWFLRPEGLVTPLDRLIGPSDYTAHLGANSGGANGVYWVDVLGETRDGVLVRNLSGKSKRSVEAVEQVIEPDLLYPLARWRDVSRFHVQPSAHILLAQDPATRSGIDEQFMRRTYPRTYAYLKRFEQLLTRRAAYRRYQGNHPFYSMYNVGPYTVAEIKVVWRRMDRRINAAVIEQTVLPGSDPLLGPRPVIPQETCVLIGTGSLGVTLSPDEAHYVCAVLNSSIVNFLVTSHSVRGGKGFGTPGMLDFIKLRRFDPGDPRHTELAACSRQAHEAVATAAAIDTTQHRINELAGLLWRLPKSELEAIESPEL